MTDTSDTTLDAGCAAFRLGDEARRPGQLEAELFNPQQGRPARRAGARRRHARRRQLRRLRRHSARSRTSRSRPATMSPPCPQARSKSPRPSGTSRNPSRIGRQHRRRHRKPRLRRSRKRPIAGGKTTTAPMAISSSMSPKRMITLDYNERYTASENYTHTF